MCIQHTPTHTHTHRQQNHRGFFFLFNWAQLLTEYHEDSRYTTYMYIQPEHVYLSLAIVVTGCHTRYTISQQRRSFALIWFQQEVEAMYTFHIIQRLWADIGHTGLYCVVKTILFLVCQHGYMKKKMGFCFCKSLQLFGWTTAVMGLFCAMRSVRQFASVSNERGCILYILCHSICSLF